MCYGTWLAKINHMAALRALAETRLDLLVHNDLPSLLTLAPPLADGPDGQVTIEYGSHKVTK